MAKRDLSALKSWRFIRTPKGMHFGTQIELYTRLSNRLD